MGVLFSFLLLLGTALALEALRVLRPRFRLSWLLAIATTAGAWVSVLLWRSPSSSTVQLGLWRAAGSPMAYASFALNDLTWPYALSLVSLALAILLTAPLRSNFPDPSSWSLCLATLGVGILATAADGPLTLVLLWAVLDLAEVGFWLFRTQNPPSSREVGQRIALRLGSMALLLSALVLSSPGESGSAFEQLQGATAGLLLPASALLRLAAFAIPWPEKSKTSATDEIEATLQFTSGLAATAFLAQVGAGADGSGLGILILCAMAVLYAGWMFLRAPDATSARPIWILGAGSLAVAASARATPLAAAGWSCAMLLAGSALFLRTRPERWTNWILLPGLWSVSSLPFSVTSSAWGGLGRESDWAVPLLLIGQALLMAGYAHLALRGEGQPSGHAGPAALRAIHGAGIGWPVITVLLLGLWGWPGAFQLGTPMAGAVVIALTIALSWRKRRSAVLNPDFTDWLPPAWRRASQLIGREIRSVEAGLQNATSAITRTLEGEAGIMWGLLFIVLLVSLVARRGQ